MDSALKDLFLTLMNKRCFGEKHAPERQIVTPKTKWLRPGERREFEREYKDAVNNGAIIKVKKRTGKGSEWHISLNPKQKKFFEDILK